jgi:plasmid stability protein
MSKMIQVRNVPDAIHRRLKMVAAAEGLSLSDFILRELQHAAARPTREEMRERLRALGTRKLPISAADIIRAERDAR